MGKNVNLTLREYIVHDLNRVRTLSGRQPVKGTVLTILRACVSPRILPMVLCRIAHALHRAGYRRTANFFSLINFLVFGLEVSPQIHIGPGLFFPHTQGTVIGARSIGSNATIFQQVTIGARELDMNFDPDLRPEIGDNVTLGAGAKILGGIRVGNGVTVGANSVVIASVVDGSVCVGVPARVL